MAFNRKLYKIIISLGLHMAQLSCHQFSQLQSGTAIATWQNIKYHKLLCIFQMAYTIINVIQKYERSWEKAHARELSEHRKPRLSAIGVQFCKVPYILCTRAITRTNHT